MDEVKAREILGKAIHNAGELGDDGENWMYWCIGDEYIELDGNYFSADELEAIVWWMRNKKVKNELSKP